MTWIGLVAGLGLAVLPSIARAELVPSSARQAFLAVSAAGTPSVAFVSGRDVFIARRTASGWINQRPGRLRRRNLPPGSAHVAGLVVDSRGRPSVLVEADNGAWLALGSRGRVRIVTRAPKRGSFGPAGLTLDAAGRPAIAYALRLKSSKTYLRLVTTDARGRLRTLPVTKQGFPASTLPPAAAPVLVRGRLHVVETYTFAAIDWERQQDGEWLGQFLFASRLGFPSGPVVAVAHTSTLWSAWTQVYPETLSVLLLSATTQETSVVLPHGILVSLVLEAARPEIGAYDWAEIGDWRTYAAIVADASGPLAELDGRLDGYAVAPAGRRQFLLSTDRGLEWFEAPSRPSIRVTLNADVSGRVTGRVDGAQGGTVQLYREMPGAARTLVVSQPLEPDGSFAALDSPPTSPTLYRAVYVEPATGIPYASLLRAPVG